MRKLIALALVAGCTGLFADGNTASVSAEASVTIYAPVTLVKDGTPFNLGKWVITDMSQAASIPFVSGVVGAPVNCAYFSGLSKASATFPTFTLGKDAALGVSISLSSSEPNLVLTPIADIVGSATSAQIKLSGAWNFPAGSSTGVKSSTVTVTATYI